MTGDIVIKQLKSTETIPYDLLLMADPSKDNIDTYISDSTVYAGERGGHTICCYVLKAVDKEIVEIMNIAVVEEFQGKGLGTFLLNDAFHRSRENGFEKIVIGTGNSSIGQLYLYQKVGFRITGIKPDFFKANYSEPIMENGIECRDMIVLTKDL